MGTSCFFFFFTIFLNGDCFCDFLFAKGSTLEHAEVNIITASRNSYKLHYWDTNWREWIDSLPGGADMDLIG